VTSCLEQPDQHIWQQPNVVPPNELIYGQQRVDWYMVLDLADESKAGDRTETRLILQMVCGFRLKGGKSQISDNCWDWNSQLGN